MPTSATGAERRVGEAGFTLVELMVVMAIVGLTASAVLLTSTGAPRLSREAEALAVRLGQARDEAVMSARAVEVVVDAKGYAFRTRTRRGWAALEPPFQTQAWPDGVTANLSDAEGIGAVRFEVTGAATPAAVYLSRADERLRVSIDGAGAVRVDDAAE
jgi:general secretion pathway protein H